MAMAAGGGGAGGRGHRRALPTFDEALAEKETQLHNLRDAHATLSSNAGKIGTVVSRAAVAMALLTDLVDDAIFSAALGAHRAARLQQHGCHVCHQPDCMHRLPAVPGREVFGNQPDVNAAPAFQCSHCKLPIKPARFTTHLEKCMGLGRTATRTSRRGVGPVATAATAAGGSSAGAAASMAGAPQPPFSAAIAALEPGAGRMLHDDSVMASTLSTLFGSSGGEDDETSDDSNDDDFADGTYGGGSDRKRKRARLGKAGRPPKNSKAAPKRARPTVAVEGPPNYGNGAARRPAPARLPPARSFAAPLAIAPPTLAPLVRDDGVWGRMTSGSAFDMSPPPSAAAPSAFGGIPIISEEQERERASYMAALGSFDNFVDVDGDEAGHGGLGVHGTVVA